MIVLCGYTACSISLRGDPESAATSELVGVGSRAGKGIGVNRSVAISGRGKIQLCCCGASSCVSRSQWGTATTSSVSSESTTASISASRGLAAARELV